MLPTGAYGSYNVYLYTANTDMFPVSLFCKGTLNLSDDTCVKPVLIANCACLCGSQLQETTHGPTICLDYNVLDHMFFGSRCICDKQHDCLKHMNMNNFD